MVYDYFSKTYCLNVLYLYVFVLQFSSITVFQQFRELWRAFLLLRNNVKYVGTMFCKAGVHQTRCAIAPLAALHRLLLSWAISQQIYYSRPSLCAPYHLLNTFLALDYPMQQVSRNLWSNYQIAFTCQEKLAHFEYFP